MRLVTLEALQTAGAPTAAPSGLDDSSEVDNEPIELVSKEGKKFKVTKRAAMISTLVKTAIENGSENSVSPPFSLSPTAHLGWAVCCADRDAKEVPLVHIESPIVEKIVAYMVYHEKVGAASPTHQLPATVSRLLCFRPASHRLVPCKGGAPQN